MFNSFAGVRVIESLEMVDSVEDWSRVRSPSRARRRMRQGYRQNVVVTVTPKQEVLMLGDTMVAHPVIVDQLRRRSVEGRS